MVQKRLEKLGCRGDVLWLRACGGHGEAGRWVMRGPPGTPQLRLSDSLRSLMRAPTPRAS